MTSLLSNTSDTIIELRKVHRKHRLELTREHIFKHFITVKHSGISEKFKQELLDLINNNETLTEISGIIRRNDKSVGIRTSPLTLKPVNETDEWFSGWKDTTTSVKTGRLNHISFITATEARNTTGDKRILELFMIMMESKVAEMTTSSRNVVCVPTENNVIIGYAQDIEQFMCDHGYKCEVLASSFGPRIFVIQC